MLAGMRSRRLVVVLVLAVLATAAGGTSEAVTGGRAADVGEYPAMVALLRPDVADNFEAEYCGGTLITESWVLTAGHCVGGGPPDVLLGTTRLDGTGSRVSADAVFVPPDMG